jgi:hypothetical protein
MEQNITIASALAAEIKQQQQLQEITKSTANLSASTFAMTKSSLFNNNSLATLRDIILKQHLQQSLQHHSEIPKNEPRRHYTEPLHPIEFTNHRVETLTPTKQDLPTNLTVHSTEQMLLKPIDTLRHQPFDSLHVVRQQQEESEEQLNSEEMRKLYQNHQRELKVRLEHEQLMEQEMSDRQHLLLLRNGYRSHDLKRNFSEREQDDGDDMVPRKKITQGKI